MTKSGKPDQSTPGSEPANVLTRTDARLIFSIVSNDAPIPLTPETMIGGLTLRQIMEHADVGLYLDLKPSDPLEAALISMLVRTQKAAIHHFNQAAKYELDPRALQVHSTFGLKSASLFGLLFDRLEKYRQKRLKSSGSVRRKRADAEAMPSMVNGANGKSKPIGTSRRSMRNDRHS
jgi:hypothetical protein